MHPYHHQDAPTPGRHPAGGQTAGAAAASGHDWGEVQPGQYVDVSVDGRSLGIGRVEDKTHDSTVVWVWFDAIEGRRLFLQEAGCRLSRVDAPRAPATRPPEPVGGNRR